jgi:uncharacterized SAM-binding protein YcdF (DUF218 family)
VLQGRYILAEGPMMPSPANPTWRRLRRRAVWLGLACALGVALVFTGKPLLVGFAHLFRVNDPAPSDALVILMGGPTHRPLSAAALYRQDLAPLVLISETPFDPATELSETGYTKQVLIKNRVPASAIHVLSGGVVTSTRDEAFRVRGYILAHPEVKRITVVTSAFHTARARWIFRKVLRGTGVDVRLAAASQPGLEERDWYMHDEGLVVYFSEAIKAVYYRLVY